MLIRLTKLAGKTSLNNICSLLALNVLSILIFSLSTLLKKFNADIIVIINDKEIATTTIPLIPVPAQTINIGANAVLGNAFKTTKNGSNILTAFSDKYNNIAINMPENVPINKAINVSSNEYLI